jgi:hypothetical protein
MADRERDLMHVYVQFNTIPSSEERQELEAAGLVLFGYLPEKTFYASIESRAASGQHLLSGIRWIGEIPPEDKIEPRILEGRFARHTLRDDGTVDLWVSSFPDEPIEKIEALLSRYGTVLGNPHISGHSVSWIVLLAKSAVLRLAEEDAVLWIEEAPWPAGSTNNESRRAIFAESVHSNYTIYGAGETGAIMDAGFVDINHQDLSLHSMIAPFDAGGPPCAIPTDTHATHVAGTMAGTGANSGGVFEGMASQIGQLRSYAWYPRLKPLGQCNSSRSATLADTKSKICDATANMAHVSNNSWGNIVECVRIENDCDGNCIQYGNYLSLTQAYDDLVRGEDITCGDPQPLSIVFSAGNEQNDLDCSPHTPCPQSDCAIDATTIAHWPYYTILPPGATAKNVITVGAVHSDTGTLTQFSSLGPTDDGRIKPDVVAPGDQVLDGLSIKSTRHPGVKYRDMAGTSMAAPAVSGAVLMLYEQWAMIFPPPAPFPATIKAILINTAWDLGNAGPDYRHGFGMIDVGRAIRSIVNFDFHEEAVTFAGEQVEHPVDEVPVDTQTLKVTLVWDDPAAQLAPLNKLVNDLDLCLLAPGNINCTHYPFVLNKNSPASPATTGTDTTNNVEQVVVQSPADGTWHFRVTATTLPTSPQDFTVSWLIIADGDEDGDGYSTDDCDDRNFDSNPGVSEICDGEDNDCDGSTPANEADNDSDGVMVCEGDCNDNDPSIYPGGIDGAYPGIAHCDGKNNDCDGTIDEGEQEICDDGVDNDCDGMTDMVDNPDCISMVEPGDIGGVIIDPDKITLRWTPDPVALQYNVYRGWVAQLNDDNQDSLPNSGYGMCLDYGLTLPQTTDSTMPLYPGGFTYIVTGENSFGEGTMGYTGDGVERQNLEECP